MRVIRATVRHILEPDGPQEFEWPDRPFHPEGFRQYLARSHGTQGFSRARPDHRKCLILDGIRRKVQPSGHSCRPVRTGPSEARRAAFELRFSDRRPPRYRVAPAGISILPMEPAILAALMLPLRFQTESAHAVNHIFASSADAIRQSSRLPGHAVRYARCVPEAAPDAPLPRSPPPPVPARLPERP